MRNIFLLLVLIIISSCATPPQQKNNPREYQIGAYLWQQRSGEYRALCYQAYNVAKSELEKSIHEKSKNKKAVILDIDETVFDNSYSGSYEIKNNLPWSPESLSQWVKLKKAIAISGARDFLNFATKNNIEIFYITNRLENQVDDTLENFKLLGIPAKRENISYLRDQWSKESRRNEIQKNHDVILYIGDNLHDFNSDFDSKTSDERVQLVEKHSRDFGTRFIIIPNPLYGDWESALPKTKDKTDLLVLPK